MKKRYIILLYILTFSCICLYKSFNVKKNIKINKINLSNDLTKEKLLSHDVVSVHNKNHDNKKDLCNLKNWYFEVVENFLTDEECNKIIEIGKPNLVNSLVANPKKNQVDNKVRTSTQYWIHRSKDPLLMKIAKRVSDKVKIPIENQEKLQILHYDPGQFYKKHYDACIDNTKNCKDDFKRRGPRDITTFIYLNDVNEGGETAFNNVGIKVRPKKGTAIFWRNLDNTKTQRHPCSLHQALPPKGEKWALTVWSRVKEQYY